MLESISFPFIVNFIKTLKDEINIYFLMEFIKGMDLFDVIRQLGTYFLLFLVFELTFFACFLRTFIHLRRAILHRLDNPRY